jgi:hypothetical protein
VRVINLHVAFAAHRFIARRPGTNPLEGAEEGSARLAHADMIGVQSNSSEGTRSIDESTRVVCDDLPLKRQHP